jgi:16S rRNA (guanine527-N7)-methyltransferase
MLDVGSGAGFPGIPLKILNPSVDVTLVDSSRKRVSFLKHAIRSIDLEGIEAVHCRVQDLVGRGGEKAFDVVICRALTDVRSFAEMALPMMADGGKGIAMKGKAVDAEWPLMVSGKLGQETGLHGLAFKRVDYVLPYADSKRVLVIFKRAV